MKLIIGHRGASGHAPENTMQAFEQCFVLGGNALEFDVHMSRDGIPVVIHDETLDRTTDVTGNVADYDWEYLQTLAIPSLREVLEAYAPHYQCFIEIKMEAAALASAKLVRELATSGIPIGHMIIIGFNLESLNIIHTHYPDLLLGATPSDELSLKPEFCHHARQHEMWGVNPNIDQLDEIFMQAARQEGLKVITWTANSPEHIEKAKRLGVDGIITDYPDRVTWS